MSDPKEDLKSKVQIVALTGWIIGCFIIFLVSSVTYHYFGGWGEWWFQAHGLVVAIVIAHYSKRIFRFVKEVESDVQK